MAFNYTVEGKIVLTFGASSLRNNEYKDFGSICYCVKQCSFMKIDF